MPIPEIKKRIQEQTQLTEEAITKKVDEKMKQLSGLISEEGALHIIANELHVKLIPDKKDRKIADLLPGMREVEQPMRVIQIYDLRTFESKYSPEGGKVASFLGGDETGVVRVTCWGGHADTCMKLQKGDIVQISNAYVKENNGRSEIHLNDNSKLTQNPPGVTVASPEEQSQEYERKAINALSNGDYRVELLGTLVQVYDPRFFERKDGKEGIVTNIMLDDGTGTIRIGCFDEVAATVLGKKLPELFSNKESTFEEEKTASLGAIILVQGRAKLNTVYNAIELTADSINMNPDPEKELSEPSESAQVQTPVQKEQPVKQEEQPPEEVISLDDLDDLDFDEEEKKG